MGTPLVAGRDFSRERRSDLFPPFTGLTSSSGPFSVLIDDMTAQLFGWESATAAIGESIYRIVGPPTLEQDTPIELRIIGAVGAQKYQFVDFSNFGVEGNLYLLRPAQANYLVIKASRGNLNEALVHIDSTWNRLMPTIGLQRDFFDNVFYQVYNIFLSISSLIAILSVMGFLIASIGLLGNATFITNIRQKEVGIRRVMGASSSRVLRMLLLDFAKPIIIANAIAWPLGYIIGNAYISLFAARAELTIMPFLISLLLSTLIACGAVISQSWKSSRVRPATVLRYE
jgi:putative ABC transport system permease protein